jgi:hypothetical protein
LRLQKRQFISLKKEYGISLIKIPGKYGVFIFVLGHQVFLEKEAESYKNPDGANLYDIKFVLDRDVTDGIL